MDSIQARIEELEQEQRSGQQMLRELDAKRQDVRDTLLRIAGAIQVLREMSPGGAGDASGLTARAQSPGDTEPTL